jgi:hypothetical protein
MGITDKGDEVLMVMEGAQVLEVIEVLMVVQL